MSRTPIIIFRPPNLSDEVACELMNFFEEFVLVLENHYYDQIKRHVRKQNKESGLQNEYNDWKDEKNGFPF